MVPVICLVYLLGVSFVSAQTGSALPSAVSDIGLGYNLLYGNPEGEHWKSGGEDPGLLVTRHILALGKYAPLTHVSFRWFWVKCNTYLSTCTIKTVRLLYTGYYLFS